MTLPTGYARLLQRMALLDPKACEFESNQDWFIGWLLTPDELWKPDEGIQMVRAMELAARTNFQAMKRRQFLDFGDRR
jgi:hypothetical protein